MKIEKSGELMVDTNFRNVNVEGELSATRIQHALKVISLYNDTYSDFIKWKSHDGSMNTNGDKNMYLHSSSVFHVNETFTSLR